MFVAIVLGGFEGGEGARLIETLARHGAAGGARGSRTAEFAPLFSYVFVTAAVLIAAAMVAVMFAEERPLRGPATWVKSS